MLEQLGERNLDTWEWIYRKIRNYGPKDQGFLDSDDLDIRLEVATWVADQRRTQQGAAGPGGTVVEDGITKRYIAPGVEAVTFRTDPASWAAMEKVVMAGGTAEEAFAALDNAVSREPEEQVEAERLLRELLGPGYKPS